VKRKSSKKTSQDEEISTGTGTARENGPLPEPDGSDKGGAKGIHRSNKLNDLTGREWITFTRSWFVHNPAPRSRLQIRHPAKYPENLIAEFINFFTKKGDTVLDPFMGVGSTLLAASMTDRRAVGIELQKKYFRIAEEETALKGSAFTLINDDAAALRQIWSSRGLQSADFIITSPPYWDMLRQSRGHVFSTHKRRHAEGLDVVYSEDDGRDIGNCTDYDQFCGALVSIFRQAHQILREGRYLVIIVQNLRSAEGRMITLAWDLARQLDPPFTFKGERIWCQDNKKLGIWGYPSEFVSNVHHHYCLIFKKEAGSTSADEAAPLSPAKEKSPRNRGGSHRKRSED